MFSGIALTNSRFYRCFEDLKSAPDFFGLRSKFFREGVGYTAQKLKFSVKDFFSQCDQIRSFMRIRSHLLKKYLMENLIFVQCQDYGSDIYIVSQREVLSIEIRIQILWRIQKFIGLRLAKDLRDIYEITIIFFGRVHLRAGVLPFLQIIFFRVLQIIFQMPKIRANLYTNNFLTGQF